MGKACNCMYNVAGECQDAPAPENLPCLGVVCWNIRQGVVCGGMAAIKPLDNNMIITGP